MILKNKWRLDLSQLREEMVAKLAHARQISQLSNNHDKPHVRRPSHDTIFLYDELLINFDT